MECIMVYQIEHVFDFGRWHARGCIVLDEHEAIICRGVKELCRGMWVRGRNINDRNLSR